MKKCRKIGLIGAALISGLTAGVYAQTAEASETEVIEEISLPDVSTVISGGAPKVGKSAVPDYSQVLPSDMKEETKGEILPQLPDSINSSDTESTKADSISRKGGSKDVYVEGLAGGGYPGTYTGNFSVYRQSGNNPFKVTFGHESSNGFAAHSVTDGYFEKSTDIGAEKTFSNKTHKVVLGVKYASDDNGLQNKVNGISDVSQEELALYGNYNWQIPHGMHLAVGVDGGWYKRFETVAGAEIADELSWTKDAATIDLVPYIGFDYKYKGFFTGLKCDYTLQSDLKGVLGGADAVNRGQFMYNVGWSNDIIRIHGDAGVVVGNQTGSNPVMVPFDAGIDMAFKSDISSRKITLSMAGGMESKEPKISDVEKEYKFTAFSETPSETSNWYGKLDFTLPVKDIFTIDAGGEFKTTAFGNGTYVPVYSGEKKNGVYTYEQKDIMQLNSLLDFSARIGIANISAEWKACWMDVAAREAPHRLSLKASLQDKRAKWGGNLGFGIRLGTDDYIPEIDAGFFYRLTPAVRLAVSADDIVKLCSLQGRTYAGDYISRSGSATILVKFFF